MLEIDRLSKRYGDVPVFDDVSLRVASGEFVALLGDSGVTPYRPLHASRCPLLLAVLVASNTQSWSKVP